MQPNNPIKSDKLKVLFFILFLALLAAIILFVVVDSKESGEPTRIPARQTQAKIRATATETTIIQSNPVSSPFPTLTAQPTRVEDATVVPTAIPIIINPAYSP